MPSYNRVILAGHATRDPQLKTLPSGTSICECGLACNRKWKSGDKSGEEVLFVDFAAFGRQGEIIKQYVTKGKSILIEGRLKLDQWQAQDGSKRNKISVVVENFQFLGSDDGERRDMEQKTQTQRGRAERMQGSELYGPPDNY